MTDPRSAGIAATINQQFIANAPELTYIEVLSRGDDSVRPWADDTREEKTHKVRLFFQPDTMIREPGSTVPTQRMTALMSKIPTLTPKTGDYIIDNFNKRYSIVDVVRIRPFGGDLLYKLGLSDA